MISVRDALDHVLRSLPRMGAEQVALTAARGRVLAERSRRRATFRRSAIRPWTAMRCAAPTWPARGPERPVRLRVLETVGAGAVASQPVGAGTATRIMTGAPVPDGADAVVRVEDTARGRRRRRRRAAVARGRQRPRIPARTCAPARACSSRGRLAARRTSACSPRSGCRWCASRAAPRVAILATGDELVDVGEPLGPGQIVNSNAYTLAAAVEEAGGEPSCWASCAIVRS